ncbi:nucleoside-triphosphatase [Winogradskyella ouciana]|uniref:nucleoside-triphosphatase n=1 Tax=Winogradskyella ouciana TaxID=2608631 RepID=UPI003D280F04
MIYILTGDIRTGKTTALLNWIEGRTDVDGVLCPDGKNGKRYFLEIKPKEEFELEVELESEKTITIGPFHFLKSAFEKANEFLITLSAKNESQYLVIDELGKLELKNTGLHDSAKVLIPKYEKKKDHHLILVVRESLFDDILEHYNISEYSVLKKDGLRLFD